MLRLTIPAREWFDDDRQEFVILTRETELLLEHSLLSLSKWEAKWKKPFLEEQPPRTNEEFLDYIRCMTINQGIDRNVYYNLTQKDIEKIKDYMTDPMTATTINQHKNKRQAGRKIITSEVIYSMMVRYGIPFECQKWHLNRLMMLIDVCAIDGGPKEKMSQADIMRENASLNAMRRAKHKTRG